eukprot:437708-Hanusia_phi.AAC.2
MKSSTMDECEERMRRAIMTEFYFFQSQHIHSDCVEGLESPSMYGSHVVGSQSRREVRRRGPPGRVPWHGHGPGCH